MTNNPPQCAFNIGYEENYIEEILNKKFLVLHKILVTN
jgi:hypothetical protein